MALFRIHIRPQGGTAKVSEIFNYCKENNLLGVGWRVENVENTTDWGVYYQKAKDKYKDLSRCKYIKNNIKANDLVWTRDDKGNYYLAKVKSGWEYFITPESQTKNIDIGNAFRVDFQQVNIDDVPGKVVACFRASRTIQRISGKETLEYSKFLWNKLSQEQVYDVSYAKSNNIFMMLDDKETEDIIYIYLQTLGWYVVPSSRQFDTMRFEYLLVNKQTKEKALVQVKTGETPLNQQHYIQKNTQDMQNIKKIFLFQSNSRYTGKDEQNVISISPDIIRKFIEDSLDWLPEVFKTKSSLMKAIN